MNDFNLFDQARTALVLASASESDPQRRAHWLDIAQCLHARSLAARRAVRPLPVIDLAAVPAGHKLGATLAAHVLAVGPTCTEFWGSTNGSRNAVRRFAAWLERGGQHNLAAACRAIKLTAADGMARIRA